MSDETQLEELISLWQQEKRRGHDLPATVICRDRPELARELARRIEILRQMSRLVPPEDSAVGPGASTPADPISDPWQTRVGIADSAATLPPQGECAAAFHSLPPSVPGYELLGWLGEGGMGVVYRARQLRPNRLVAVKMLRAGGNSGRDQLDRFRREAELLAQLQHPNIVPVYEVGERGGLPYFCMELVDGGSLDRRLAGNPMPPREAAALVEVLSRAISAAHAKGIIHRDLKPGNILMTADGTPKVSDFGLAKRLDGASASTATGAVLGTPNYMAPEQADDSWGEITPGTDVYALGAVLYELLTGRPPFKGASAIDTLLLVKTCEPVGPRRLQPSVARDLEAVCLKCLEKSPSRRYPGAVALAEDLRRFLDGRPTLARPVGPVGRAVRWSRRRPVVAGLLALLVAVVAGALTGLTALYLRAEDQRSHAENESIRAEGEKKKAEAAAEAAKQSAEEARRQADAAAKSRQSFKSVLLSFRESDPLGFLGGFGSSGSSSAAANPIVHNFLKRAGPELLRDRPADPAARAELLETIGDLYRSFGDLETAAPLLEEALALREQLGTENADYASCQHSLARAYHDLGRYTAAEELYQKALALRRRLGDALGVDETLFNLAWLLTQMADYPEAEELFLQVNEGRRERDGEISRPTAVAKAALAALYLDRGQFEKALPWSNQAFAIIRHLDGEGGLGQAAALFQVGVMAAESPFPAAAVKPLTEAEMITRQSMGPNHPYRALIVHELGRALENAKDDQGAEVAYTEALRVARDSVGFGHPKVAIGVGSLARLLARTDRAPRADALFDELLEAHRRRFGDEHFLVADALVEYARFLGEQGEKKRKKALLAEALAMYRKEGKPRGRLYALCLNDLAMTYGGAEGHAEAERLLDEALRLVRRQYGETNLYVAQVLVNLASVRLLRDKIDGVEELLDEAEKIGTPALAFLSSLSFAPPPDVLDDVFFWRGDLYRQTRRLADAEATALRRRASRPNDPDALYGSACDLALLVPLDKEPADRERHSKLAVETLRLAKAKGFKDVHLLETAPELAKLRERDDFRQLLRDLRPKP